MSSRPPGSAAGRALDCAVASVLGLLVLVVHDVGYLLRAPYWLDESWVAVAAKVPLRDLPMVSASSPLGWTLLVRLQELGGEQRQRLVPLAFAALAVALGYLLLRSVGSGRLAAALAGGGTVLLVPAMLVRGDLKQYTADAAVFLLLLLCVSRLEATWSRRRLVALAVVVGLAPLFSTAAVLGGAAAMAAVVAAAALQRHARRLRESLVAAIGAGACLVLVVLLTVQRNANSALTGFWADYYLPRTPSAFAGAVDRHVSEVLPYLGGPSSWVVLLLVLGSVGVLAGRGRLATALVVPLGFAATTAAGVAHVYPFLDVRTSTWLLVGLAVCMGIAVAGAAERYARKGTPGTWAAVGLVVFSCAWAVDACGPWLRAHSVFAQDVGSQVAWVEQHRQPGDVVLVPLSATWAYSYYAALDPVPVLATDTVATGFVPDLSVDPRVLTVTGRGAGEVERAAARAVELAGPEGNVWVVRTQVAAEERPAWDALLARCGTLVPVGVDPLLVLDPGRGC